MNTAVSEYCGSAAHQCDCTVGMSRLKKITLIIMRHTRAAFMQGLAMHAAVQVGLGSGKAARVSYAAQPLNGPAAQDRAQEDAEAAIAAALATEPKPVGLCRCTPHYSTHSTCLHHTVSCMLCFTGVGWKWVLCCRMKCGLSLWPRQPSIKPMLICMGHCAHALKNSVQSSGLLML